MEDNLPPSEIQLTIDGKINNCRAAIYELRSQRNKSSPSSRISSKLLGNIFTLAAPENEREFSTYGRRFLSHSYGFSLADRHWRRVALSTPAVWRFIILDYPNWARLCLERSESTCLTVEARLSSSNVVLLAIEILQPHMNRVLDLRLSVHVSELPPDVIVAFTDSLPRLESFKLYYSPYTLSPPLPPLRFGSTNLSVLDVYRCQIDWKMRLQDLTSLTIHRPPEPPGIDEFFGGLSQMPQLRMLDLENALPSSSDPSNTWPVHQSLCFAQLKNLSVTEPLEDMANFLRCLQIPTESVVSLIGSDAYLDSEVDIPTILSVVEHFFGTTVRANHGLDYNTFEITDDCGLQNLVHFGFWSKPSPEQSHRKIRRQDHSSFSFGVPWKSSCQILIRDVISAFPFESITTLLLFIPIEQELFEAAFGSLTQLEAIMFNANSGAAVVKALGPSASTAIPRFILPRLKKIGFENMIFSECRVTVEQFHDCIAARREQGIGLEVLVCNSPSLYRSHIRALKCLVPIVEWFG